MSEFSPTISSVEMKKFVTFEEAAKEKVDDINKFGTAFTRVPIQRIDSILRYGLLGHGKLYGGKEKELNRVDWARNVLETKQSTVHFNIVGKMRDADTISESHYFFKPDKAIGIIFDLNGFEEKPHNSLIKLDLYTSCHKVVEPTC